VQRLSPAALAYVGDAVYELYVRTLCLMPPKRIQSYHEQVVAHVRAETQADFVQSLESLLTPSEIDILRRGRNAAARGPRRVDPEIYQQATGLETLLGYLYLCDPARLADLLKQFPTYGNL
jgi:ribonuclease-3 family protein